MPRIEKEKLTGTWTIYGDDDKPCGSIQSIGKNSKHKTIFIVSLRGTVCQIRNIVNNDLLDLSY